MDGAIFKKARKGRLLGSGSSAAGAYPQQSYRRRGKRRPVELLSEYTMTAYVQLGTASCLENLTCKVRSNEWSGTGEIGERSNDDVHNVGVPDEVRVIGMELDIGGFPV